MRVKVRAVIWRDGRVVVCPERRQDAEVLTLPGGRVKEHEGAEDALVREVREEAGLDVVIGPLVYVAEVVDAYHLHELNPVFDAAPADGGSVDGLQLVDVSGGDRDLVRPPILAAIAADAAGGWPPPARWLGNVYQVSADR